MENPFPAPTNLEGQAAMPHHPEIEASPEKGSYRAFEKFNEPASLGDELRTAHSRLATQCSQTENLWLDSVRQSFFANYIEQYAPTTLATADLMDEIQTQIESLKNRLGLV